MRAAGDARGEMVLKLPFLDKREIRRRSEVLSGLQFERSGNEIRAILNHRFALRTAAAELVFAHPAWTNAPPERHPGYFSTWQGVSIALQAFLRTSISQEYFRDLEAYLDRETAYPWIVYQAARIYHGNPPHDFTYDLTDFPERRDTIESTWRLIGASLQKILAAIERRLHDEGQPALARRYAPRWHEDVLKDVRRKPKVFYKLMAVETELINAVIDLGTARSAPSVTRFARTAILRLKNLYSLDLQHLAMELLHETTRVLTRAMGNSAANVAPWYSVHPAGSFQKSSASDRRT